MATPTALPTEEPSPITTTTARPAGTTPAADPSPEPAASPSQVATGTAAQAADPPPAPTLITVATGEEGELLLEWTPSSETVFPTQGVTGWQYRQQYDVPGDGVVGVREDTWEAWTDVPGSTAATRSHRLTGLTWRGWHYFQVRAVAGLVEGAASEAVRGSPPFVDEHGMPAMVKFQIVEGGRTWRLTHHCPTVFDVPAGTRLMLMAGPLRDAGSCWLHNIRDVETGSEVLVDPDDGRFLSREIVQAGDGPSGAEGKDAGGGRDVNAIFDQIRDSVRLVEPPEVD